MTSLPENRLVPDQPAWVTPEQAALWQQFIRFMFDFGLLDRDEVSEVLRSFVFQDADGREWTVGADTGQWYWRDAQGAWNPAAPPPALRPPALDLSAYRRPSAAAAQAEALASTEVAPPPPEPASAAGAQAALTPPMAAGGVPAAGTAPAAAEARVCTACGTSLAPGQAFCVQCGTPVRPAAPPARPPGLCAACGTQNGPGSRFCIGCGAALAG